MSEIFTPQTIALAAISLILLIASICVHEFGHAFVADRLGDPLPRSQGRVTLNPLAHIDPIGTLLFPLAGFFLSVAGSPIAGMILGWGKPVYTSPRSRWLRGRMSEQTANLLISVAGPLMNVLLAAIGSVVFVVLLRAGFREIEHGRAMPLPLYYLGMLVRLNIALALFNLLPCPPLDGRSILEWFFPPGNRAMEWLRRYGSMLFIALLLTGLFSFVMIPVRLLTDAWMGVLYSWAP